MKITVNECGGLFVDNQYIDFPIFRNAFHVGWTINHKDYLVKSLCESLKGAYPNSVVELTASGFTVTERGPEYKIVETRICKIDYSTVASIHINPNGTMKVIRNGKQFSSINELMAYLHPHHSVSMEGDSIYLLEKQ